MAFKQRSSGTFKMMGSSPMKQDVGIITGFGPEADANLKAKINRKTVVKKSKKGFKKIAGKFLKKALPIWGALETGWEAGKFARTWQKTGSIEKAWDKHKWWGSKEGNLLKADDPDPNEMKAIDLIRKAKT